MSQRTEPRTEKKKKNKTTMRITVKSETSTVIFLEFRKKKEAL